MIFPNEPKIKDFSDVNKLSDSKEWGTLGAHDPSIFKDEDYYYVFSTDAIVGGWPTPAVQIRKSKDLITWEYVGQALKEVPKEAKEWTDAPGIWAPEMTKVGDEYYLYYCASAFGKNRSCIGLLKSKSIEGPWIDNGIVIKTDNGDDRNAIDPNIVYDENNDMWMSYGSFWTGIYLVKLDKNTGSTLIKNDMGINIARRHHSVEGAVEGPYLIYNNEYKMYYLFVSYDSLASDYNIRVGRSANIEGPYVDINGNKMIDIKAENPNSIGNKIAGGYRFGDKEGWIALGHNSVLNDNGDFYIVHHARKEYNPTWFYMHVRKILWSEAGWPMVSPERYAGEVEQEVDGQLLIGNWHLATLYRDVNRVVVAKTYEFTEAGEVNGEYKGSWKFYGDNNIEVEILIRGEKERYKGKVIPAWDWEENKTTVVITAIDESGIPLWGKKV